MTDIRGIVLQKILLNEEGSLEAWSKLKLGYFGSEYVGIYRTMSKFYINHSSLPTFEDLLLYNRNPLLKISIEALKEKEPLEVDLELAVEALVNDYTQEEVLGELDTFLDNITLLDTAEIKEELGNILLRVEEKTLSAEEVIFMNDIEFIKEPELLSLFPLGLNNTFDSEIGGMSLTEVLAIGGMRGSGKSNVCTNLSVNQYEAGNTSIYFSIEMRGREVFNREIALLSGVSLANISKATLTDIELFKIATVRAAMFQDSSDLLENYKDHKNYGKFEKELIETKKLKEKNQLIIVDNQRLTLANIDLTLQKFKAQFGDKLKLVVVDYLNQIDIPDKYEWKTQIHLSAKLKEFARKYDVVLAAPYQIDKTGEARFSKGILDSVDIAMTLERSEGRIDFVSTKTRNAKAFEVASPMNELTMRIDPNDANVPPKEKKEEDKEEKKPDPNKEGHDDIPW
tara:strand:+ start:1038 stop:2402 length:1365 start_codon:yes stop_codon:yes gene_type:complete